MDPGQIRVSANNLKRYRILCNIIGDQNTLTHSLYINKSRQN